MPINLFKYHFNSLGSPNRQPIATGGWGTYVVLLLASQAIAKWDRGGGTFVVLPLASQGLVEGDWGGETYVILPLASQGVVKGDHCPALCHAYTSEGDEMYIKKSYQLCQGDMWRTQVKLIYFIIWLTR